MDALKVLMLGPGTPNHLNSGLGVAAMHIADFLSKHVELILIEPQTGEEQLQGWDELKHHRFTELHDEWRVASEIVRINIQSEINPYHYAESQSLTTEVEEVKNELTQVLEEYTHTTIEKIKGISYDLIYAHDWTTLPTALRLKEETGKPLVVHFHSLDYDRMAGKDRSWVYDLEQQAVEKADAIITVSNYSSNILQEHYDFAMEKVFPIHNGYEAYDKVNSTKKVAEDIILFVGRMAEQKGPGIFLEIAAKVHAQNPNTRFVMAGTGEKQKELIESGAYQSFAHKFHFTGHLDKERLQELYAISSVYCMPSVSEPFGLSAVEAANAGLPMVLSKQSGAAEVLKGAYTCDHWEILDFSEKIIDLLSNKKACKKMIEMNRKSLQSISWENTGHQILEVFNSVTPK